MKIFLSGYKNITQDTLSCYLINYYYYNIYNKYFNNNYPNKHKIQKHNNIPFEIKYFSNDGYCFINIYDPIFYFHLITKKIKFKSYIIINIDGYLTKQPKSFTINIKKFKQIKIYLENINKNYDYDKLYEIVNECIHNISNQYILKYKINYLTGQHTGKCTVNIYNSRCFNKFIEYKNNFNRYNINVLFDKK